MKFILALTIVAVSHNTDCGPKMHNAAAMEQWIEKTPALEKQCSDLGGIPRYSTWECSEHHGHLVYAGCDFPPRPISAQPAEK